MFLSLVRVSPVCKVFSSVFPHCLRMIIILPLSRAYSYGGLPSYLPLHNFHDIVLQCHKIRFHKVLF